MRLHVYKSKNEKKKIERCINCVLIFLKYTIGNFENRLLEVSIVCACMWMCVLFHCIRLARQTVHACIKIHVTDNFKICNILATTDNTFTLTVRNLIIIELLLFVKSQFTTDTQNILHPIQCPHGHV
jgi:hypothetical protein